MKSSYEKYCRYCLVFNRVLGTQRFVRSFISSHLFQTGDHMKTVVRVRVRRQLSFPSNSFRFLGHLLFFLKRTFYKSLNSLPPPPPPLFPSLGKRFPSLILCILSVTVRKRLLRRPSKMCSQLRTAPRSIFWWSQVNTACLGARRVLRVWRRV